MTTPRPGPGGGWLAAFLRFQISGLRVIAAKKRKAPGGGSCHREKHKIGLHGSAREQGLVPAEMGGTGTSAVGGGRVCEERREKWIQEQQGAVEGGAGPRRQLRHRAARVISTTHTHRSSSGSGSIVKMGGGGHLQ